MEFLYLVEMCWYPIEYMEYFFNWSIHVGLKNYSWYSQFWGATRQCVKHLVGKVVCRDILKFNDTDTDTDMSWHVFLFSNISKFFMLLNGWCGQHWNWKWHQKMYIIKNIFYCCTILNINYRTVKYIFFSYYFYFADKYTTYMISFIHQKNIFSEDNFFVSKSTICDQDMPQTRDSE